MTGNRILNFQVISPFLWVGLAWLIIGSVLSCAFRPEGISVSLALFWMVDLWALSMLDLLSMAKLSAGLIALRSDSDTGNPGALQIQALFWGVIKLVCLGLFGAVLLRVQAVPTIALFSGFGTLLVVALVGGFWWSQRELSHA